MQNPEGINSINYYHYYLLISVESIILYIEYRDNTIYDSITEFR